MQPGGPHGVDVSDNNQILRLLGTIREECAEMRKRQEELYELLISYKDQIEDVKATVLDKLSGLPKSPYIAGQLVPAPEEVEGVDDFQHLLATYLHKRPFPEDEGEAQPEDVVYEPPPEVDPSSIKLEDEPGRGPRGGGRGGRRGRSERRPRDMDLERGPDRDIEPLDLDADDDDAKSGGKRGGGRRGRRRGRRGRGKGDDKGDDADKAEKSDKKKSGKKAGRVDDG